jgi:hypothetical protein
MRRKDLLLEPSGEHMRWLRWRAFGNDRPLSKHASSKSDRHRLEIKAGKHEKLKWTGETKTRKSRKSGIWGHGGCGN